MSQKKNEKKVKNQDSMGKTNSFLSNQPLDSFSHMAVGAPQKI
jgi:hypothetical protein